MAGMKVEDGEQENQKEGSEMKSIHPFSILSSGSLGVCWSLSQASQGEGRATPRTRSQFIAGPQKSQTPITIHTHTHTYGQLREPGNPERTHAMTVTTCKLTFFLKQKGPRNKTTAPLCRPENILRVK